MRKNVFYLGHLCNSVWVRLPHISIHEYNFKSLSQYSNVVIAAQPLEDYLIVKLEIGPIFVHNICTLIQIYFNIFKDLHFHSFMFLSFIFPVLFLHSKMTVN